ncbi:arabinogalactan oligomer/maltooligosaccharide transport system substrate-binding protein [Deinococcus metalli]|uniref:Arabinogalactan oligomer/maltooligosaccharide transport system substrate-binding protein n=1 Tax=Deinococcus metalli TaxID=1141878 RepID=A0A7W8NQ20_9DEIO|nr:maltose ABC transporter substrate-binding protein [Deinococcus metalli]MBB5375378.1 arabinogalactan oligomer/maltooligosaccharide transport system substrate-binding protein [Deinococcus metalli]GHF29752.1 maltose ABC transporter substrate-binding protein [Deinococcus metalli]
MKKALTLLSLALATQAGAATLTVWSHFGGPELAWLKDQAAAFQKKTGNQVNIVTVPLDQMKDKFIQAAPKGQGPDLLLTLPHDQLGALAAAGVIEPMDKYVTSKTDLDKTAVNAMTYQGKLFGIPMYAEAVAVVYNKKLVPNAPTTWADFLKVAQSNTGNGKFGYLADLSNAYMQYGVISAYGGYVFKNNGGTLNTKDVGLANAGADKASAFLNDLRYKYNLVPEGVDGGAAKSAFVDGKLAMLLTGPWDMGDIKKAGVDYGITAFPTPPGATGKWSPFVGVQGTMINAYSKNKALAAQFAKAVATGDAQVSFNKAGGRIPVSLSARTKLKADPVVVGFGKSISAGTPMPNVPAMGAVWGPWSAAIAQSVQKPNQDYDSILNKAVTEINGNIK